jgi:iron complex outermembrane receptor protein
MTNLLDRRRTRGALSGASLAVVASVLALAASPAAAQDNGPAPAAQDASADTAQNGDSVVTAPFRETRLQDTPLAITATSGADLAARGQTKLTDLQAPSLAIQPATGGYGPAAQIYIRGVGQYDSNFSFEPGVGVYIDDVYYSTVLGNVFNLVDLDRVEVLRGPQGTLAGKNSIGGAIKLYSKKPDGGGSNFVEVEAGSYNLVNVRAAANMTIVDDKVFARISGMAKHTTGYVDRVDYKCANPTSALPTYATSGNSCLLGHEGGSNDIAVRGQLRILPVERLEINLSGDYFMSRGDPSPDILIAARQFTTPTVNGVAFGPMFIPPNNYTSYALFRGSTISSFEGTPKSDLTSWGLSGSLDYEIADGIKFTSITAYRSAATDYGYDYDLSPIPKSESNNQPRQHQFTQEVRLNAEIGKFADLTVGGFYYRGSALQNQRSLIASINSDFFAADTIESKSKSAFAHVVVQATDRLNLTGGVRYTDDNKVYTFHRRTADGSFSPSQSPLNNVGGTFSKGVWDWRAVVDYRWSDAFMTYAQFSTGFKGGGVNPRPFAPNQVVPFGPERLKAYEVGFKSDFLDRMVRLNVSAFYNQYSNLQLQSSNPFFNVNMPVQNDPNLPNYNPTAGTSPSGVFINAGDAHRKGFEAELTITPTQGLRINGSLSYLEGHYTSLLPQATISGLNINMELPFSPKWQGNLGIQYELPVGSGTLTPRIDYEYKGKYYANPVNDPRNLVAAHNVFNAHVTYRTGNGDWEFTGAVTNLTDKFYWVSKADLYVSSGYVTGIPSRPREWSLTLRRNF